MNDNLSALSPLPRRSFLKVGSFSVATAALLAACGGTSVKTRVAQAGATPETSAVPDRVVTDAVLLRTASSLEHSVASAYEKAISMNVLTGEAAEFAGRFLKHHHAAAKFFEEQTTTLGGTAFTDANPAVAKNILDPSFTTIADSADKAGDVRNLLHSLEDVATGTYQSFVPLLNDPKLRVAVMSVGTVGARQSSVWAAIVGAPVAAALAPKAAPVTTVKGAVEAVTVAVYQVPSAFAAMGLVPTLLNTKKVDLDLLGPNSFAY